LNLEQLKFKNILCIGAHSDDIEIGCGGTILKLLEQNPQTKITWIVFSGNAQREDEARKSAESFLQVADHRQIQFENFKDAYFPYQGTEIKTFFQSFAKKQQPDLILTHRLEDRHQDHRLLAELTWNAFRNHLIWEYEIPKYEGDLGQPNIYVQLKSEWVEGKIEKLMKHFPSQFDKRWFSADTFQSLLRIRGLECHSPSGFAEGFYCRKFCLG